VQHPGVWVGVGASHVQRVDPPRDLGKFSCLKLVSSIL
jgi:hypothetical protein